MSEEKKESAANAGSSDNLIPNPPAPADAGQATGDKSELKKTVTDEGKEGGENSLEKLEKSYKELEQKLGEQGKELGDYRKFFEEIQPLLTKLDEQPELTQAILDGKVDASLAKAAIEGKISVADAKTVTEAYKEVKKEVGEKKYSELKPEEIEQRIIEKITGEVKRMEEEITNKVKKTSNEINEMREYRASIDKFIAETKDFSEYATEINKWIDEHPDQDDIQIAYDVVKGRALRKKAEEDAEASKADVAKNIAANAAGGGSQGGTVISDKNIVDKLIGNSSNPNVF